MSRLRGWLLLSALPVLACHSSGVKGGIDSGGIDSGGMSDAMPPGPATLPSTLPLVGFMSLPVTSISPKGSTDYDALFADGAPWAEAMAKIGFFGIFGNLVADDVTSDVQLQHYVGFLNAHALPIGFEMAMISDASACAAGIEGTVPQAGFAAGAAQRIHQAGGAVRVMRADDPWSSHLLAGNPCNWTAADVAQRLAATAAMVRAIEPDVRIETTETLQQNSTQQQLLDFVDAYGVAAGRSLDGFVLDIDYSRPNWGPEALAVEAAINSRGIRFGVIYHGAEMDADDAAWSSNAESRFADYELLYGGKPDEVLLESWMALPQHVLPETQVGSFTNLVDRYYRPRPTLTAALSGSTVSGTLVAAGGAPIAGATIDARVTLESGGGAPAHYTATGTVPAGATQVVVGLRANEECNCTGNADLYIYSGSFTLGSDPTNLVSDGDFAMGPWYSMGTGSVTTVASDLGAGQMMHVTATPAQMELIQPGSIAVSGGQTYAADFYARIPPSTVGSGDFVVIFLGASGEIPRVTIPFTAATTTAGGVSNGTGGYAIDLGAPPTNARVDVWYRGDATHFPAHAGL